MSSTGYRNSVLQSQTRDLGGIQNAHLEHVAILALAARTAFRTTAASLPAFSTL
jgi:hypothetical protein